MIQSNVSEITQRLRSIRGVSEAGAAPEDKTNVMTFQVKLDGGEYMHNEMQRKVVDTVRRNTRVKDDDIDLVVASSKEYFSEGYERELFCFWVWVYGKINTLFLNGREYHVIGYNSSSLQVRSAPEAGDSPVSSDNRWIEWEKVDLSKENFEF